MTWHQPACRPCSSECPCCCDLQLHCVPGDGAELWLLFPELLRICLRHLGKSYLNTIQNHQKTPKPTQDTTWNKNRNNSSQVKPEKTEPKTSAGNGGTAQRCSPACHRVFAQTCWWIDSLQAHLLQKVALQGLLHFWDNLLRCQKKV